MGIFGVNDLPRDVLHEVLCPFLGDSDFLKFSASCKAIRNDNLAQSRIEKIRREAFTDRYGAIAQCECDIPVKDLGERTEVVQRKGFSDVVAARSLFEKLTRLLCDESFLKGSQQRSRSRLCKEEGHRAAYEKTKKLFEKHHAISREFLDNELDQNQPLQDLRNKCRRLQILQDEQESLLYGLAPSFKRKETVCGCLRSILLDVGLLNPITASSSFYVLNQNKIVKLSEFTIDFQQQQIPVEIISKFTLFDGTNFEGKTEFVVQRKKDGEFLGRVSFRRLWQEKKFKNFYSEFSIRTTIPVLSRDSCRLTADVVCGMGYGLDIFTGDLPVMRLLAQIAVEVFSLEPESVLEISSRLEGKYVFLTGGFRSEKDREREDDKSILRDIRQARIAGGVFPDGYSPHAFKSLLHKSDLFPGITQFTNIGEKGKKEPALVDFELDSQPITWEEKIQNEPLIQKTKGPILPKFFKEDLHKYEE